MKRFEAAGWARARIDGHDPDAIDRAIELAKTSDRPTLIACKTTIGFGAPKKAGTSKAHGEPLGAEEIDGRRAGARLAGAAFEVPGRRRRPGAWPARAAARRARHGSSALPPSLRDIAPSSSAASRGDLPPGIAEAVAASRPSSPPSRRTVATRKASEMALEVLTEAVPESAPRLRRPHAAPTIPAPRT